MDTFVQQLDPIGGSLFTSALVALIPILFYLIVLAVLKVRGWLTGLLTMILAMIIGCTAFNMPGNFAVMAAVQGVIYAMLPIGWIIWMAVFLYKMTIKTGHFDIIRDSIVSLTDDRRIQALIIAFSFGAFLEGASGFGAPVAITAALLVGLGFKPLYAAGICLLANTAPVAFGAVGVPVTVMDSLGSYANGSPIPATDIAAMIGRQLPLVSVFIPFYLVVTMAGFKKALEVLPAVIVAGGSFAISQFFSSNFMGPELPDILSALVSLLCTVLLLRVWKPKTTWKFEGEPEQTVAPKAHSVGEIITAWMPFLILTLSIAVWTLAPVKAIFKPFILQYAVPLIHNNVINSISNQPIAAMIKLDFIGATGTAILVAAIISKFVIKISWSDMFTVAIDTFKEIKLALLSICFIVGFAYVMNASGMTNTLGSALAATGGAFAFCSAALGWIAVFITGSDAAGNLLFGKLQQVAASGVGIDPLLAMAANASGGVTGKMISPQSIAIGAAAVGLLGRESELLRFTVKHSIFLLIFVSAIVALQSTPILGWMIPMHP